jgi:hypothetical protein
MKKSYFIILFLLMLLVSGFVLARVSQGSKTDGGEGLTRNKVDTAAYSKLTIQDRKDYTINIDQFKITKPHDTVVNMENMKYSLIHVTVRLSNHSGHTLKYIIMTCSWDDQFLLSNKNIKILSWPCQYNASGVRVLIAHKDTVFTTPVVAIKQYIRGEKFRIAMRLFIRNGNNQYLDLPHRDSFIGKNLIWSNEVELP